MFAEDLDVFLADHGLPCSCGAVNFKGIKDEPDETLGMGGLHAQSTMTILLVKSSVIQQAGIKKDSVIIVDGVNYISRVPERKDDGAFTSIPLSK
jgi:hypothetical protein